MRTIAELVVFVGVAFITAYFLSTSATGANLFFAVKGSVPSAPSIATGKATGEVI
jgi:hypothetical protein